MRTTYLSDRLLNHFYRATASVAPATVYAALLTGVTDAEAGTVTEASFAGYAREPITFGAPAAGLGGRQIANTGAVLFDAKTDSGSVDVIAVGIYDDPDAGQGNLLDIIYLDGSDPVLFIGNDVTNNFLRSPAHGLTDTQQVRLEVVPGTGSLPTGLSEGTTYFVRDAAADEFKLATTSGGVAIDITAQGRGMLHLLTPKTIDQNDQANFAIDTLKLADD